jgi:hypothetical protein
MASSRIGKSGVLDLLGVTRKGRKNVCGACAKKFYETAFVKTLTGIKIGLY